jgi:HK97 family phage prohead protease
MPYSIVHNHPDCPIESGEPGPDQVGGHAVVKDDDGQLMGCHKSHESAEDQIKALYAAENERAKHSDASTPAPKEDQIEGSKKNKPGSASGKSGDIKFSEQTEKSIKTIVETHNEMVKEKGLASWRRLRIPTAKAVVRRGFGAYSTSHRPGISRNAWGLARLKAFGYLLVNDKPKNSKYVGDNDLLPTEHPKYAPKNEKNNKNFRHDISVPDFIKNNASRGLENLQFAGSGLTEKTKREARQMRDGIVSHDKALRMQAWFKRHISDFEGQAAKDFLSGESDRMSPGLVAWLLWGGSLAAATRMDAMKWAERQVARHEDDRSKSRPRPASQAVGIIKRMSDNKELRYFELRAEAEIDSEDLVFTGYASVFDTPYAVSDSRGVYNETVNRGAFSKTLKEQDDVKFLINHDGIPLARTKSGTLELREDEHGLFVKAQLDESNPRVAEISSALKRGDLSEMSFGFHAIKDEFSDNGETRTLKELRLLDVSVVTWPANPATLASVRGVELGELQSVLAEVRNDEPNDDQVAKINEVIGQLTDLLPKPNVTKSNVRAAVRDLEVWDMQSRS